MSSLLRNLFEELERRLTTAIVQRNRYMGDSILYVEQIHNQTQKKVELYNEIEGLGKKNKGLKQEIYRLDTLSNNLKNEINLINVLEESRMEELNTIMETLKEHEDERKQHNVGISKEEEKEKLCCEMCINVFMTLYPPITAYQINIILHQINHLPTDTFKHASSHKHSIPRHTHTHTSLTNITINNITSFEEPS